MTALILADDFVRKAADAGRELLASGETTAEIKETPGHFVSKKGTQLPEGAVEIATIKVDETLIVIYTTG